MMKKFISVLFISLFLVLPFRVGALELEKSFEQQFDVSSNYNYYNVINSYNGNKVDGYIVFRYDNVDTGVIVKFDNDNNIIWEKEIIQVNELNTYASDGNFFIDKIDVDTSKVIWKRQYDTSFLKNVTSKLYSYDNNGNLDGYLLFADIKDDDDRDFESYLVKYSLDGKMVWKHKLGDYSYFLSLIVSDASGVLYNWKYDMDMATYMYYIRNFSTDEYIKTLYVSFRWPSHLLVIKNYDKSDDIFGLGMIDGVVKITKYTVTGDIIYEKPLSGIDDTTYFSYSANSKSIFNNHDGVVVASVSKTFGNFFLKYDYDGNLLLKESLPYTSRFITESYDSDDNFNGYIVIGDDWSSSNTHWYITKFTYPKRVIEAKDEEVEVPKDAYPGKSVSVKAKEKEGYVVKRIIVRDSSGNEIEVSSDGTFVMPDEDVSIEVVYEKKIINPDTASAVSAVLCLLVIIVSSTILIKYRRRD